MLIGPRKFVDADPPPSNPNLEVKIHWLKNNNTKYAIKDTSCILFTISKYLKLALYTYEGNSGSKHALIPPPPHQSAADVTDLSRHSLTKSTRCYGLLFSANGTLSKSQKCDETLRENDPA